MKMSTDVEMNGRLFRRSQKVVYFEVNKESNDFYSFTYLFIYLLILCITFFIHLSNYIQIYKLYILLLCTNLLLVILFYNIKLIHLKNVIQINFLNRTYI